MQHPRRRLNRFAILTLLVLAAAAGATARQHAPPPSVPAEKPGPAEESGPAGKPGAAENTAPPLAVASVKVMPEKPAAETLCQLEVTLANRGQKPASALAFTVELDGFALPVYDRQLFVETVAPGETVVRLFNFWTSEPDRPLPADGTIDVRVTLLSARWLTRDVAEDGTEILTLGEAVPGLPASASAALVLER